MSNVECRRLKVEGDSYCDETSKVRRNPQSEIPNPQSLTPFIRMGFCVENHFVKLQLA